MKFQLPEIVSDLKMSLLSWRLSEALNKDYLKTINLIFFTLVYA